MLALLKQAFADAPAQTPPLIVKLYCATAEQTRRHVEVILKGLGVDHMDVAQLCSWADFAPDFRAQGPRWQLFQELRDQGVISRLSCEVYHSFSANAKEMVRDDLADAYSFYYNARSRETDNELFALLEKRQRPVIAMRTLGGFDLDFSQLPQALREKPGDPLLVYLAALRPIFENSSVKTWLEFNVRFLLSQPMVATTVGATRRREHLRALLAAVENFQPLAPEVVASVKRLQRQGLPPS